MKNKYILYVALLILLFLIVSLFLRKDKNLDNHISGGVVPHHAYADFIITDFFKRLSVQNPKTIILIGPNHLEKGNGKILTSQKNWDTKFGILETDNVMIADLIQQGIVVDDGVLLNDQSITYLTAYIKHYLPSAKITPILLSGFMKEEELGSLSNILKKYLDDETDLIASVDFSHYLSNKEAEEKDKVTIELIKNFDYEKIATLDNNYLDSPPSVIVLLMTMQAIGKVNQEILFHTNSGEMQKNDTIKTTSYFSIIYR